MGRRDDAERCLERLHDQWVAAGEAAEAARLAFLTEVEAATADTVPSTERVRMAALARRLGVPRGTLLARLDRFREEKDGRAGAT